MAAGSAAALTLHHDCEDRDPDVDGGAPRVTERPGAARRGRRSASGAEADGSGARASRRSRRKTKPKLSVLVCSDDPLTRRAFSSGVSAPDMTVVTKTTLAEAIETVASGLEPDIVVLDVQVAAGRALATIQRLHEQAPAARILACDAPAGTEFGLLCLIAGASGYVSKELDLAALPRLVRNLSGGEAVIPRALATELAGRFVDASRRAPARPERKLSMPESQVLELLRGGPTLYEVADELGIGLATAQRHLGSARRKLAAHRVAVASGLDRRHETRDHQEDS
jgi:DNA-binding NarL/FixJ family response regulator